MVGQWFLTVSMFKVFLTVADVASDGTTIEITGGGDEIVARRNYDRFDTHFNIDTTLLFLVIIL